VSVIVVLVRAAAPAAALRRARRFFFGYLQRSPPPTSTLVKSLANIGEKPTPILVRLRLNVSAPAARPAAAAGAMLLEKSPPGPSSRTVIPRL
jgi:hypothetical protein